MKAAVSAGHWLLILGHAAGLRWVLQNSRVAFSKGRTPLALRIRQGDEIFLYVGRSAFKNPTRDESQLLGIARASQCVAPLSSPVRIGDRTFVSGARLELGTILPKRAGVPFRPLISRLSFIIRKKVWSAYMRPGLIRLSNDDARVLRSALAGASAVQRPQKPF
jgi:hypothetical protein